MKDIIIIGGGIVGFATAYKILEANPSVKITILEKEAGPAFHQTGNNSGVIHSGIYYKPGSWKARNCVEGYNMLLEFCNQNQVQYEICGKIIVATEKNELSSLRTLFQRGRENGLANLRMLEAGEITEYEKHVNGIAGIHVPQTGIIDYTQVVKKLIDKIRDSGAEIIYNQKAV